jgi:DNA-binding FadR family transcriptional regulator
MNRTIRDEADRVPIDLSSELLNFLADEGLKPGDRLPAISELAQRLGISTGKLREQLEVARTLGLVEVRPKTGTRVLEYRFLNSLRTGLLYALATDPDSFGPFGELRNHVEAAFWHEAVTQLTAEDRAELSRLVDQAWAKLHGEPVQIPHNEHRELHLTIYRRLDNQFVRGLLEAYWEAYEAVGLAVYNDYQYLEQVWHFHEDMVRAIENGDVEGGYQALIEHTTLLNRRPELNRQSPEPGLVPAKPQTVGSELS